MSGLVRWNRLISIHAPPRRSATHCCGCLPCLQVKFQSTHPREGVRLSLAVTLGLFCWNFNPRTPAKECDRSSSDTGPRNLDFNPRTPAKECDNLQPQVTLTGLTISIHAPPRRSATDLEILSRCVKAISIHAPPRRSATPPRLSQNSIEVLFQSTHPREGVRPYDIQLYMMYSFISIHAPPRRSATFLWMSSTVFKSHFNPRTPAKECDASQQVAIV